MLRIIVQLVPFGDESRAKEIHRMVIANTGENYGNYEAWIGKDEWTKTEALFGKVNNHDRSQSVWFLIKKVIESCFSKEFKEDVKEGSLSQRLKKRL